MYSIHRYCADSSYICEESLFYDDRSLYVMNPNILSTEVQAYLKAHAKISPATIALRKSPFSEVSSSELAEQVDSCQRLKTKLPTWLNTESIYFPPKQNAEQCSSQETANYKAKLLSGRKAIDLTGGFGVDTWAFAKNFNQVDYCEMNTELFSIVKHNFLTLSCTNVNCHFGDGLKYLKGKSYDLIYLDPARRDKHNRKMVSFSDCLPDVIYHQNFLLDHSPSVMIKASPMMDISLAIKELQGIKEIHVVAVKNECKELLFVLEKNYSKEPMIICKNLPDPKSFSFKRSEEQHATAPLDRALNYLYEPNTAILKAGAFNCISERLNLRKLHASTHLYTSEDLQQNFPGKVYKIEQILDYNKKKVKRHLPEGQANIKSYNFPNTPQQIQKKLGLKDGGNLFLFGVKTNDEKYQLIKARLA